MFIMKKPFSVNASFSIDKFNESGVTFHLPFFKNTVLSSGLFNLFTNSVEDLTAFVNIGTDNTAPANDQTGLIAFAFSSSNIISTTAAFSDVGGNHLKVTKTFRFDIGSCTGSFKEIGLSKTSNTLYFNRQLLKNAQGDPITVVVDNDEGMLIKVEICIYLDPEISLIGEKLSVDLNDPTSGSFKFTLGTNSSTDITYAQFVAGATEVKAAVKELVDADLVVDVIKEADNTFTIEFLPLAGQTGLGLDVTSLVGYSAAPTITVTRANPKLPITFNVNNIDLGSTKVMKINRSFPMNISESLWGLNEVTNPLYTASLQEWTYEISGKTPSSVERTPPTIDNPEIIDVCTWLPGRISEDPTFNFHSVLVKLGGKSIYEYRITDEITISNTEEVKWTLKRGYGRWSDINP